MDFCRCSPGKKRRFMRIGYIYSRCRHHCVALSQQHRLSPQSSSIVSGASDGENERGRARQAQSSASVLRSGLPAPGLLSKPVSGRQSQDAIACLGTPGCRPYTWRGIQGRSGRKMNTMMLMRPADGCEMVLWYQHIRRVPVSACPGAPVGVVRRGILHRVYGRWPISPVRWRGEGTGWV